MEKMWEAKLWLNFLLHWVRIKWYRRMKVLHKLLSLLCSLKQWLKVTLSFPLWICDARGKTAVSEWEANGSKVEVTLLTHLVSYRIKEEDLFCLRSILPNECPLLKHYLFCYCTTVNYPWLCWLPLFILKLTSVVMQSDAKLATTSVCPQNNSSNEDLQ